MTVSEVLSSCMNILYGATVVDLYGRHSEWLQCKAGDDEIIAYYHDGEF